MGGQGGAFLDRFGRHEALAGLTAVVLLVAATVGVFSNDAGSTSPSAIASAGPDATFDPLGDLGPLESATAGPSEGPGQATVGAPATTSPPLAPPGAKRVLGPAKGTPVKVGVHVNDNSGAGAQFGVGGLPNISDAELRAVIEQVNAAGGLSGRPIEPIIHRTDPLNGSFDAQGQAACETFTDDNDAQIVVDNALSPSKVVLDCLAKRKIPLVWELHMSQVTNAEMTRYMDYLYRPSMPNADRLDFVIDGLNDAKFFKGARVGILRYDSPESKLISDKAFKPRLKALGIPVVAEVPMTKPSSSGGAAGLAGQSSNAVLEFNDKDVSHVLFVPSGGAIPLTFLPAAASQGYEPAYGFTTQDAPDFIGQNFPESQLSKAMVVGWAPDLDGDDFPRGAALARCKKSQADAGLPWDDNMQPYCDAFYFLHASLYNFDVVSAANLKKGVEALGSSYESPFVLAAGFGPGRHDGPKQARMLRYDAAKPGWRYFGSIFSFN